jgi:hypothetical protein
MTSGSFVDMETQAVSVRNRRAGCCHLERYSPRLCKAHGGARQKQQDRQECRSKGASSVCIISPKDRRVFREKAISDR